MSTYRVELENGDAYDVEVDDKVLSAKTGVLSTDGGVGPKKTDQIDFKSALKSGADAVLNPSSNQMVQGGLDPVQRFGNATLQSVYGQGRGILQDMVPEKAQQALGRGMASAVPGGFMLSPKIQQAIGREGVGVGVDLGVAGAMGVGDRLLSGAKNIKLPSVNLQKTIRESQSELSGIESNLAKETEASKAQVAYNVSSLKEQRASELGRLESMNKEAEHLNKQAIQEAEKKSSVLGQKLPDVAYKTGQRLRQRFIGVIRKHSEEYKNTLDGLIGGKNQDIYIQPDKVLSSIEDELVDRGVSTVINDKGKMEIDGAASTAEARLVRMYNKLQGSSSVGVRQIIHDKQMLGRQVGYGSKSYGYDDDLIDSVVKRLGKRLEAEIPGLSDLNKTTSKFLRFKDEANARLDLFKEGSPKPREFVESYAKSNMTPEQKVFMAKLEKELPDFREMSKPPKAMGEGIAEYDQMVRALKEKGRGAVPEIAAKFDAEIEKLQSNLDIDLARLSNEAQSKSGPIVERISKAQSKLRKLKFAKDALIVTGAVVGAAYGTRSILNYGYNALFKD